MLLPSAGNLLSVPRTGNLRCKFLALWHCYLRTTMSRLHSSKRRIELQNYSKDFKSFKWKWFYWIGPRRETQHFHPNRFWPFSAKNNLCIFFDERHTGKSFLFCPFKIYLSCLFFFGVYTDLSKYARKFLEHNRVGLNPWTLGFEATVLTVVQLPIVITTANKSDAKNHKRAFF